MSNQPVLKYVGNLGDVNFLDYGSFLVYEDTNGVYPPQAEIIVPDEGDGDATQWTVYRVVLEKCTYINGILSDNKFYPDHSVWFANHDKEHLERHGYDQWKNFCGIAESIDLTGDELADMFCSDDTMTRAKAYQMVIKYHGNDEFDQYPIDFNSKREMKKRYSDAK